MHTGHFASYTAEIHRARLIGALNQCCKETGVTPPDLSSMSETELIQSILALQTESWLVGTLNPQRLLGGIAALINK